MAKFTQAYTGSNIPKPEVVRPEVPPLNPLKDTLGNVPPEVYQGADIVPPSTDDYAAARSNAVADIPANQYQDSSAGMTGGDEGDYSAVANNEGQPSAVYEDIDKSSYWAGGVDKQGNAISEDRQYANLEQDRRDAAKRAGIFSLNYATEEELSNHYDGAVAVNGRGTIHRAAIDMSNALGSINVNQDVNTEGVIPQNGTNGFEYLAKGTDRSDVQTANNATVAFALVAPVISGALKLSADTVGGDGELAGLNALLGGDLAMGTTRQVEGGLPDEALDSMLGSAFLKLAGLNQDVVDEAGRPIDPATVSRPKIPQKAAGALLRKALVSSGMITPVMVNGQNINRLSPTGGSQFYLASRDMATDVNSALLEMSSSAPVTDMGESQTAQRRISHGDVEKTNYTKTPMMTEAKRILGFTPLVTSPARSWIAGMMMVEALKYQNGDPAALDTTKHMNVELGPKPRPDDAFGTKKYNSEMKQKVNKALRELAAFGKNILSQGPRFSRWWEDYSTHRLYQAANDVNMQRNLISRNTIGGIDTPRKGTTTPFHKLGIPRQMADKFWNEVGSLVKGDKFVKKFDDEHNRELGFLLTVAHALDIGPRALGRPTTTMHPKEILANFTPAMMQEAAVFGRQLKSMIPSSTRDISNGISNPSSIQITPEQRQILSKLMASSDNKTWGQVAQASMDMANYIDAKERGIAWTPRITTTIDQNSAGRAFLAMDIGKIDVLERVGVIYQMYNNGKDWENILPHGNPRDYFMEVARDVGIKNAIPKNTPEIADAWLATLDKYSKQHPKFVDNFGKKALMTTDYGKPIMFHQAEAADFLAKYPEFRDEMLTYYPGTDGMKDLINATNDIFTKTLYAAIDTWQQAVPKDVTKILQMLGRSPEPEGMMGEKLGLGGFIQQDIGKQLKIEDASGTEFINLTRRVSSALAAAKDKSTVDENGDRLAAPGEGSAAINQVGPMLGQLRESMVIALTLLHFNKGKAAKDIMFAQPVFDNYILNSDSFAQFHYYANNVAAEKVFSWDIQTAFVKDFQKQMREGMAEIDKQTEVNIGKSGKYWGTLVTLDREFGYMQKAVASGEKMWPKQQAMYDFLMSPSSGYVPPEGRPDTVNIKPHQLKVLINKMMEYKLTYTTQGHSASRLTQWAEDGLKMKAKAMKLYRELARGGNVGFMT